VGIDHDTAAFAVATIRHGWEQSGPARYPAATRLLITADGGGSNGVRTRLWTRDLQCLADETGLAITVCHFPPGTSKWNKIEHRLFSSITQTWRGQPLVSYAVILSLIAGTTTTATASSNSRAMRTATARRTRPTSAVPAARPPWASTPCARP